MPSVGRCVLVAFWGSSLSGKGPKRKTEVDQQRCPRVRPLANVFHSKSLVGSCRPWTAQERRD